jgi:uncharacterized protein YndB with AHSA1/START domain
MRHVEAEALVGASRDEVWKLYDDLAGLPRWLPSVVEVVYVSGPARVGAVYRARRRLAGIGAVEQWEIVHHRYPVRQVRVSQESALRRTLTITFEARGTGTWVHHSMELRSGLWGPLAWAHEALVSIPEGTAMRAAVGAAKRVFEGEPPR